jgi:type II secretory pathway component GspD/PulD (secretin)
MPARHNRQIASLFLSLLLISGLLAAQAPSSSQIQAALVHPDPKRAQKAVERGQKAEAAGRIEEALAAYDEAARFAPQDITIVGRGAALRSKLVRSHVDAAERAAVEGYLDRATKELGVALRLDPGNSVVTERLAQIKAMDEESAGQPEAEIPGLPKLQPKSGKHSLNLRGDTKAAYEQVAALWGVKVAFDTDLPPHRMRLRVDDVSFETAMSLLGSQTGTFWRALNSVLMFVAPDTPDKRRQYALEAEQIFPLSSAVSSEDMTEILRILREITEATHIELNSANHSITMRDTPEKLALAGKVIRELEKTRGEVMLDIQLLEVDRNTARKLGLEVPTSEKLITIPSNLLTQLKQAKDIGALTTLLAGIFGSSSGFPAVILLGGGQSSFLLTLPSTVADYSDALSLARSGQQVLLRAQDGKPASFFLGERYPITLSLLSGSLGTGGFTGSVGGGRGGGGTSIQFPTTDYAVGNGPVALVVADFNNDGLNDLAVVNENDNSVSILLNQSANSGTFVQATNSPISLGALPASIPTRPPAITSGVLTSSGFHDLLITDPTTNTVKVLLGNGDGTFKTPLSSIPVGAEPSAIVTGDFNNDAILDFAVTNFGDSTVSIFNGNADASGHGDGTFTQSASSPIALPVGSLNPVAMTRADFDANKLPDLAILTNNNAPANPGNVVILLNNPAGTFTPAGTATPVGHGPVAIDSGDVNGDGIPDVAVVNQGDNTVAILLNHGDGTLFAGPNPTLATGTTPSGLTIADFDQDGIADIATANEGANTFSLYKGLGGGNFLLVAEPLVGTNPTAIAATSLTHAQFLDLVTTDNPPGSAGQVTVVLSSVVVSAGSSGGGGGLAQQAYPASQYEDIGLKIKATPWLHPNHEVTLQLDFEIRGLSGTAVNGIPVISNRTFSQTVRLKEDEPTLVGAVTDLSISGSFSGLPGLSQLPGIGYAFGARNKSLQDTELMILMTPRRLRFPERNARLIYAGRGDRSSATPSGPSPAAPPAAPAPAPPPAQPAPETTPPPSPNPPPPQSLP